MHKSISSLAITLLVSAGCGATTYKIKGNELERLTTIAPEQRGAHVRVAQDWKETDVPAAPPVTGETQIVIIPNFEVSGGGGYHYTRAGGGPRYRGGGSGLHVGGGNGSSGKAEAVVWIVVAGIALVTVAAIEAARFDGYAQLHPMQPVHLIGKDGGYAVMPLAWVDPYTASWTDYAIIRSTEGPLRPLERAPLDRQDWTYAMLGGTGTYLSRAGELGAGPAFDIQLGYYITQEIGIVGSVFFGWRDNRVEGTLFESRYMLELQALPVHAGVFHAGLYGGVGYAYRLEDTIPEADEGTGALAGGALFQLELDTRIALTGRLGVSFDHGVQQHDVLVGLSVF